MVWQLSNQSKGDNATSSSCEMDIPEDIICVDCGEKAYRLTPEPEFGWETGDFVAYRCRGCQDRWDLVVEDPNHSCGGPDRPAWADEARRILEERRQEGS